MFSTTVNSIKVRNSFNHQVKSRAGEEEYPFPPEYPFPQEPVARDKMIYHQPLQANIHHFYLYDSVDEPTEYLPLVKALGDAAPTDQFVIHINCWGGDVFSAIEIITAITQTEAPVIASIEGACASAATMIALACEGWSMSDFGCFMVHAPTMGRYGKFNELNASHDFDNAWTKNLFHKIYKDFLSDEEIDQVLEGKDLWFSAEETIKRLQVFSAARQKAMEELECEEEGCTCIKEEPKEEKPKKTSKKKLEESKTTEEPTSTGKAGKKASKAKVQFTPDKSMPEGMTFIPSKTFLKNLK